MAWLSSWAGDGSASAQVGGSGRSAICALRTDVPFCFVWLCVALEGNPSKLIQLNNTMPVVERYLPTFPGFPRQSVL